jgi:putative inorganic carbon (HCO3(-)) transporter
VLLGRSGWPGAFLLLLACACAWRGGTAVRGAGESSDATAESGDPGRNGERVLGWRAGLSTYEPLLVMVAAPFLVFPNILTPAAAVVVFIPWLSRRLRGQPAHVATALDAAVLGLVIMMPVGVMVSVSPGRAIPKIYGVLLGVAVLYLIAGRVRSAAVAWNAGFLVVSVGLVATVFCLLVAPWPALRWRTLLPLGLERLGPQLAKWGGSLAGDINRNEVAAFLTLLLPLAMSMLWSSAGGGNLHRLSTLGEGSRTIRGLAGTVVLALSVGVMFGTLVLTESRSGWVGLAAGLLGLVVVRQSARLALLLLALGFGVMLLLRLSPGAALEALLGLGGDRNVSARYQLWMRALQLVVEYPWTGVGLNTFSIVVNQRLPLPGLSPERVLGLTHAHNVFLQVAMDLGLPGLGAYLAALLGCGAKPGILLWASWGLAAAIVALPQDKSPGAEVSRDPERARQ